MIKINKPINISPFHHTSVLTTDASKEGWGGTLEINGVRVMDRIYGDWKMGEQIKSSNYRETSAVLLSLQTLKNKLIENKVKNLLVQTDN
jgi:hypothetical protein